jgi:hypothetical protein
MGDFISHIFLYKYNTTLGKNMYSRYDVRYNCFRMKKGNPPKDPAVIALVEEARGNYSWTDFGDKWDVIIKKDKIVVFPSIKDINSVTEVCAKKQLTVEMKLEKEWNTQEEAIIMMVEAQFLDNLMTWENYKKSWNVRWDADQNRIITYLLKLPKTQEEVTQEMIDKKLQESIANTKQQKSSIASMLEARPMTEVEKKLYELLLAEKKI